MTEEKTASLFDNGQPYQF